MPEEINRLAVDAVSDLYFVTEPSAVDHLLREGKPASAIHEVGNVMVDNLFYQKRILDSGNCLGLNPLEMKLVADFKQGIARSGEKSDRRYAVLTLHRPSNVDDVETLSRLLQTLKMVSDEIPIAFTVHPRTRACIERLSFALGPNIHLFPPLPFMAFLELWKSAAMVLTDSGGLQEETTALGVPCITLRNNTERPVTVSQGTNVLVGTDGRAILGAVRAVLAQPMDAQLQRPKLWDGQAAHRIVLELARFLR